MIFCVSGFDIRQGNRSGGTVLDVDAPSKGTVELHVNKAYNPPCAYNPYTTCPLPPLGNRLRIEIRAGEKIYKHERVYDAVMRSR